MVGRLTTKDSASTIKCARSLGVWRSTAKALPTNQPRLIRRHEAAEALAQIRTAEPKDQYFSGGIGEGAAFAGTCVTAWLAPGPRKVIKVVEVMRIHVPADVATAMSFSQNAR